MARTLAELRAQNGPAPLPKAERTVTLIEGQHLLTDAQRLTDELADLRAAALRTDEDGKPTGPPRKSGEGGAEARERADRQNEISDELDKILVKLGEHQALVGLVGMTGGDWQRFKDEHPPREDSEADKVLTGGVCNSTVVFEAMGNYVATWNGEPVAEGDWDAWLADHITYSDRRDLVIRVVLMHEQGLARAPKSLSSSSSTESSETD